jgi:RecB family exonuclease
MEMQQSRPRVPSFYALDVMRAVTGRVPDYRDLEREAAQAAQARLAWPAPADPQAAIDESEHDLAVLQQRAQARVPGGARFLLELHPHLARSLRARYDRWERRRWLPADGLISERAAIRELLAAHGLRERPYSVSSLQTFAACPYRFLLTAIYRLRTRQDPVPLETLDPQTRGAMFHKAQAEMIRYLIWAKKYPVAEKDLPSLLETLWGLVEQVARQYEEELAPAIPRVWADAVEGVHGDLRGWLAHLAAEGGPWQPVHVEYGFGRAAEDGLDPASSPVPARLAGGFQLRGAIDLIERHAETGELRITDHKTGRNNTEDILLFHHGESLQPSLYALAAEALLGQRVSGGRLFFATAAGGYTEHTVKLDDQVRKAAGDILQCIEDFVQQAFLPAAPRPEACEWCDFREVCGPYEEVRTAKKDPEHARLEDLRWLRDIR